MAHERERSGKFIVSNQSKSESKSEVASFFAPDFPTFFLDKKKLQSQEKLEEEEADKGREKEGERKHIIDAFMILFA